jgi:hypothetical protein
LCAALGDGAFDQYAATGAAMDLADAVEYARHHIELARRQTANPDPRHTESPPDAPIIAPGAPQIIDPGRLDVARPAETGCARTAGHPAGVRLSHSVLSPAPTGCSPSVRSRRSARFRGGLPRHPTCRDNRIA